MATKTGQKVAVVGSGPLAWLRAARARRPSVTLFEKNDRVGGLLRYGIPTSRWKTHHRPPRRADEAEGVVIPGAFFVGAQKDAPVCINWDEGNHHPRSCNRVRRRAGRRRRSRDLLPVPGLIDGIHFAMDFLPQQNARVSARATGVRARSRADSQNVVVIGGDTGSDCGTATRRTQMELSDLRSRSISIKSF